VAKETSEAGRARLDVCDSKERWLLVLVKRTGGERSSWTGERERERDLGERKCG
jgi:hypothetical protein